MKRHRTIVSTLAAMSLLAGLAASAPAGALASGPLLSGYGGPGAGAQAIVGAALLNGPGSGGGSANSGSSGGSSSSSGGGTASGGGSHRGTGGAVATGAGAAKVANTPSAAADAGRAHGDSAQSPGARSSLLGGKGSSAAPANAGTPWFSGGDLLALVLVAGALALTAVATARLARTHDARKGRTTSTGS